MLICCTEDGLVHNFFYNDWWGCCCLSPLQTQSVFTNMIWYNAIKSKSISQYHKNRNRFCGIIVSCSRRNMVAGSRMELRFGRTDQSPVRKETMAEWRLPRWSHCKLWWKLNVGTISKMKMGNLNLFDISHDFYRLPALYHFEKYHIWKHYVLENKFWFHPS